MRTNMVCLYYRMRIRLWETGRNRLRTQHNGYACRWMNGCDIHNYITNNNDSHQMDFGDIEQM